MTYDGSIVICTKMDTNGLNKGIAEIKVSLTGLKGVLGDVAKSLGIGFSIEKLVEFGAACVDAGAEATAAEAQFSQVFGSLRDEAEESLEAIAGQAGSTASAMRGCYNQIAAFAKTTGMNTEDALDLTNRALTAAADSTAFYDRSLSDVTENLQSFLKGNYENDAALGLSCTETTRNAAANALYGKSFADLSEAQKQLTLLQMVEDANKLSGAMGQAAREADSWTSQTQLLKDQFKELMSLIGSDLILALSPLLETINEILNAVIQTYKAVRSFFYNLFGIEMEDVTAASSTMDDAATSADNLTDSTEDAADAAGDLAGATGDVADATGDLADATKEAADAQRSLLGFDQITKLTEATSSGSGSGSGSGGNGGGSGGSGGGSGGNVAGSDAAGNIASPISTGTGDALGQAEEKLNGLLELLGTIGDLLEGLGKGLGSLAEGIGNGLGGLIEGIGNGLGGLVEGIGDGLGGLTEGIGSGLGNLTSGLGNGLGTLVEGVGNGLGSLLDGILPDQVQQVKDNIEESLSDLDVTITVNNDNSVSIIQQQLAELNVVMQNTSVSVTNMGRGFGNAWERLKQWISGLPVLGPLLGVIYENFKLLGDVLRPLTDIIDNNFNSLKFFISGLDDLVKGDWQQALQDFQTSWDYLKNNSLLQMAIQLVKKGWKTIEKWIGKIPVLSQAIKLIKSGWSTVKKWVGSIPVLSQAMKLIKSGWSTVKGWIGNIPTLSQLVKLAKSGWSSVKSWIGSIPVVSAGVKLVKNGWKSLSSFIGSFTKSIGLSVSWKTSGLSTVQQAVARVLFGSAKWPSLKFAARGGIVDTATLFGSGLVAGEAGREAILPLENNTEWMNTWADKAAEKVVQRIGGNSGRNQPITVNVTLDGKIVATSTINYINGQARSTGVNPLSAYL